LLRSRATEGLLQSAALRRATAGGAEAPWRRCQSWPPVWAPSRRHQRRLNWAGAGGGSRTGLRCHFARAIRWGGS